MREHTNAAAASWTSPPAVAAMLGVEPAKVIGWIRRGELIAANLAESTSGRPRYKIDPAELQRFLDRRSAGPLPKPVRRRRREFQRQYYT